MLKPRRMPKDGLTHTMRRGCRDRGCRGVLEAFTGLSWSGAARFGLALGVLFGGCEPSPALAQTGYATYYTLESVRAEGNTGITASGEAYQESRLTCALPSRCFGCKVRVTSLVTGKSVELTHTDFGPGKRAISRGVVVDLTPAAFLALGHRLEEGRVEVRVEPVLAKKKQRKAVAKK